MKYTQIALLQKYGLTVRGSSGQHLLIDPNMQRKIVELVGPKPKEWILEIGPGLGALTGELLVREARVIAVEKDPRFCEILEEELGKEYKGKLRILNEDILKVKLASDLKRGQAPTVNTKGARPLLEGMPRCNDVTAVSNLPYYITSPILFWLIENRSRIQKAVLMMQREVADRLLAQPGTKDYGRLTLAVRYYAEVRQEFYVSKNCFTPRPDVDSTVLTLTFHPTSKLPKNVDKDFLFQIIKTAFGTRRKTLLNCLSRDVQIGRSRSELMNVFGLLGISETARAEDLLLKDFIGLAASLRGLASS